MKYPTLFLAAALGLFSEKTAAQTLQITWPVQPGSFCDLSSNDPLQWNDAATYNPFGISGTWSPTYQSHDLPDGEVNLSARATAGCGPAGIDFKYLLSFDLNGDGIFEKVIDSESPTLGFGIKEDEIDGQFRIARVVRDIEPDDPDHTKLTGFSLPYGLHKIKWFATGCGESDTLEHFFVVKDCKKPTVVCLPGLAVNAVQNFPSSGVTLWATDFLQYAEDNATDQSQLDLALRDADINPGNGFPVDATGLPQNHLFWDCSTQLGTNPVELWARDKAGNADFCLTYLILSDNLGICEPSYADPGVLLCISAPSVGGSGLGCAPGPSDVTFDIGTPTPSLPPFWDPWLMANAVGCYSPTFGGAVPVGAQYTITPKKDLNPLNGISTFDLVRISKHILNVQPFTNPLQYIAADINHNGHVTTFDIVELRKLILGIYSDFPANESWRFLLKPQYPGQAGSPIYSSSPCIWDLAHPCQFDAVKIGDVTGDAICNNFAPEVSEDRSPTLFSLENRPLKAGQTVEIPVFLEKENALLAWQLAMDFNPDFIDIKETLPEGPDGSEAIAMVARTAPGRVAMNWFSASPRRFLGGRDALISLKINVLRDCKLSGVLFLENENLAPEVFLGDETSQPVALIFSEKKEAATASNLTAWPNPFSEKTTLEWSQIQPGEAAIDIFDATGRAVFSTKILGEKGGNRFTLDGFSEGLFFVKIQSGGEVFTASILAK